jgi:hypothetical protein
MCRVERLLIPVWKEIACILELNVEIKLRTAYGILFSNLQSHGGVFNI